MLTTPLLMRSVMRPVHNKNEDAIFTSEKLDKSDELVDTINKLTINDSGYDLKKVTASDAQGDLARNPDTVTHTSSGIFDQKLLSGRIIREVSVFPPPTKSTIIITP